MNRTSDQVRQIRKVLRVTQLVLVVILVATVWASTSIELWQKVLIGLLAILLVAGPSLKNRFKGGGKQSN